MEATRQRNNRVVGEPYRKIPPANMPAAKGGWLLVRVSVRVTCGMGMEWNRMEGGLYVEFWVWFQTQKIIHVHGNMGKYGQRRIQC